jgi:hypothetical protein
MPGAMHDRPADSEPILPGMAENPIASRSFAEQAIKRIERRRRFQVSAARHPARAGPAVPAQADLQPSQSPPEMGHSARAGALKVTEPEALGDISRTA